MKKFVSLLMVVAALVASTTATAPAQPRQSGDLVQTAVAAGQFKTLARLLIRAGLVGALEKPGPYTVFAPTDAAFAKVPKKTLKALGKNKAALKQVLLYHVVKGSVPAKKLVKLRSAKTVEGSKVRIKVRKGNVYLNGSTKVTKTDVRASDGIIHVINKVLIPKDLDLARTTASSRRRGTLSRRRS
jgi:uncharacterized surface protein with fasciclin (FAS1) repeats